MRVNVAGVMDKHNFIKRKEQEKKWLIVCFTALDGEGEGKEGKYILFLKKEINGIKDSLILCRQGKARINIGIRQPNQVFLMELC